ncbi:MAG TPA: C25 family cysteine peptidase [Candidatus Thermoplasmatota archaeon]
MQEAPPVGIRIEVEDVGRVTVPISDLRGGGLPARISPQKLKVTNEGGEVPFELVRNAQGTVEAIAFDNLGLATPYTGTNVFIVTWGTRRPRLLVELTRFDGPPPRGSVRVEKDRFYAPGAALGSDPWVWDFAVAGTSWPRDDDPDAGLFDLPELDIAPDAIVPVRVRVASVFGGVHTAEARINGVSVGSVAFAGRRGATVVGEIPAAELRTIGNTLSLDLTTDAVEGSLFYIGHLDVLASPRDLPPAEVLLIEPYAPSLARRPFQGVDYLVLTHPDFADQARRIARIKKGQGHRAAVVDVQDAYDQYTAGITDAAALDQFIADVARLGALRYVLVVGDDSFDPLQRLGGPGQSFVPSLYAWDGEFGRVASEALYADVDGNLAPDVAIGRLPVSTAAEADTVVAKIARQAQASAPTGRHVFAVDNQAPGDPSFEAFAEQARSLTGATDVAWVRISDGIDAARQALREGLGAGAPSAHFFGHGTFDALADERLVDTATVGELAGSPETPIFAWACESHGYPWPFGPSLGESLLLLPKGGASASFGPAGMTAPDLQSEFLAGVYPRFFGEGLSLGEAIRRAKAEAMQNAPGRLSPVVHGWNLLGDPSLRLSR